MLVYLGEEIGLAAHELVLKLLRLLQSEPPEWLRNIQPAYTSLMVSFDLCRVDHAEVESVLRQYLDRVAAAESTKRRTIEIPVCYGGEFGPDLEEVAKLNGLKPAEVIKLHSSPTYHAYFLGFAPGFAYLGEIPEKIAAPRLETPRRSVPIGSVGIAGRQTAIYPFATPGGWRLIGRTPLQMFRRDRKVMPTISIGDQVRFRAISGKQFSKLEAP
jgi:inhibitor of KinA